MGVLSRGADRRQNKNKKRITVGACTRCRLEAVRQRVFYPEVQTNHCGYLCLNEMVNTLRFSSRGADTRQRTNHCEYL